MKRWKVKQWCSVLMALLLCLGLLPGAALADSSDQYITHDASGKEQTATIPADAVTMTDQMKDWEDGKYYVVPAGEVQIRARVAVAAGATVHLILRDGAKLNASQGITVPAGATLIVYGQSAGRGELKGSGTTRGASIGGLNGTPGVDGTNDGALIVHGGKINVSSIGGGKGGDGSGGAVTIYGGTVMANGGEGVVGIGGGNTGSGTPGGNGTLTLGPRLSLLSNTTAIGDKTGDNYKSQAGGAEKATVTDTALFQRYMWTEAPQNPVAYVDRSGGVPGEDKTAASYTEVTGTLTDWSGGWYVVKGAVEITGSLTLTGGVNLILCDGTSLTVNGNVAGSGAELTVYGQKEKGDGALTVKGSVAVDGCDVHGGKLAVSASAGAGLTCAVGKGLTVRSGDVKLLGSDTGISGSLYMPQGMVALAGTDAADALSGSNLELNLDGKKETDLNPEQRFSLINYVVEQVFDAYMTSNRVRISDFHGGTATVTFPYTLAAGRNPAGLHVYFIDRVGGKTEVPSRYRDGELSFDAPHFSNYVPVYEGEETQTPAPVGFTDVTAGDWFAAAVNWASENAVMNGMGDGTFAPYLSTTRAMVAQILYNLENRPVAGEGLTFSDVVSDAWYYDAVTWASSEGIVKGNEDGTFAPDAPITREQLLTIIYRYAVSRGVDVADAADLAGYSDAGEISDYAVDALRWAVGTGLASGRTAETLNPLDTANRAEVATILMRYCTTFA